MIKYVCCFKSKNIQTILKRQAKYLDRSSNSKTACLRQKILSVPTDQLTDIAVYRGACSRLKLGKHWNEVSTKWYFLRNSPIWKRFVQKIRSWSFVIVAAFLPYAIWGDEDEKLELWCITTETYINLYWYLIQSTENQTFCTYFQDHLQSRSLRPEFFSVLQGGFAEITLAIRSVCIEEIQGI